MGIIQEGTAMTDNVALNGGSIRERTAQSIVGKFVGPGTAVAL